MKPRGGKDDVKIKNRTEEIEILHIFLFEM